MTLTPVTFEPATPSQADEPPLRKPKKPKMDVYASVRWSALSKYGTQGMQFAISMVLARLLAPEYFGLLGMAMVITGFVQIFKNLGFNSAIVQRKQLSHDLLSTLFWVNLTVCLLMGLVVLGIAPLAALLYDDNRVTPVIAVLAVNFVFAGFTMIPSALLQRRMEFKKLAIRELGGVITAGLTAVPLAYLGWGVWALVASSLTSSAAQMVLINLAVPFRPRFVFDRIGLSECFRFGINLTGFNFFNYFARNADNLIIGVFLGPVALGYYSVAYKLMLLPRDSITSVITRVLFPAFSKMQDDDDRLANAYLRACGAIAMITFPMMIGLAVLADPFVRVVLGEKWLSAVPLIWILAPLGAIQSLWNTAGQLFLAKGRADLHFRLGVIGGILFVCSFLAGVPWGVTGVALAYAVACLCWIPFWFKVAFSLVGPLSLRLFARTIRPHVANSIIMGASMLLVQLIFDLYELNSSAALALNVPTGVLLYGMLVVRCKSAVVDDLVKLAPSSLSNFFFAFGAGRG